MQRTIYVRDPELWVAAQERARRSGTTLSEVIMMLLAQYVNPRTDRVALERIAAVIREYGL